MDISTELLKKYGLNTFEEYSEAWTEIQSEEIKQVQFYKLFLNATDHIPLIIFENYIVYMVENNVNVGSMKKFFSDVKTEYADVLEARKIAREEINRIEAEMATE